MIGRRNWVRGYSWTRSPGEAHNDFVLGNYRDDCVGYYSVRDNDAAAAAFKLNMENILFASAASAAQLTANFSPIAVGTAMGLRINGSAELPGAFVTASDSKLTYSAPPGSRLVVVATAEDGATCQFSRSIDTQLTGDTLDLSDVAGALGGKMIAGKAWIEKDAEGQLAYATNPINISAVIRKKPNVGDFVFTPPGNLTYDGDPKEATVSVKPGITGMGEITAVHYYDSNGAQLGASPTEIGKYTVAIDVAEGSHYTAATGLTDESWTFEITPAPQEPVEIPDDSVEMPETPSEDNQDDGINVLIADVDVTGQTQRIMVRGPYRVLTRGTKLVVEVAPPHEELDDQGYEIEQQTHYNIWLLNEDGTSLPMPLSEKVELLFQILKNGNGDDLEIVLVTEGEDIQFEENTVEIDGIRYRRAYTDHFSPYSLLDKLTEEEKNALNTVKTGDELTYVTISGLGLVMALALGLMLNSKIRTKKLDM